MKHLVAIFFDNEKYCRDIFQISKKRVVTFFRFAVNIGVFETSCRDIFDISKVLSRYFSIMKNLAAMFFSRMKTLVAIFFKMNTPAATFFKTEPYSWDTEGYRTRGAHMAACQSHGNCLF